MVLECLSGRFDDFALGRMRTGRACRRGGQLGIPLAHCLGVACGVRKQCDAEWTGFEVGREDEESEEGAVSQLGRTSALQRGGSLALITHSTPPHRYPLTSLSLY